MQVKRHKDPPGPQYEDKTLELVWDDSRQLDRVRPMGASAPWAIPELGIAYKVRNTVAAVDAASADNPLKAQDEITDLRVHERTPDGREREDMWQSQRIRRALQGDEWAQIFASLQSPSITKISLKLKGTADEVTITPADDLAWPLDERGLALALDVRNEKAHTIAEAVALGFRDTHRSMTQIYYNLRGMFTGQISPVENLGGPVTIARIAYAIAGHDFWEFVFFIGLISINLAVINFLPIPVLDGGHMVFLLYEMVRGKPASERIRVGATYAGLILILSLMVFVLYLDISRLVRGG
jgi:regulator of sigma E protease